MQELLVEDPEKLEKFLEIFKKGVWKKLKGLEEKIPTKFHVFSKLCKNSTQFSV